MYPKFKINLIGLAVALGVVLAGFGLGEPPRAGTEATPLAVALTQDGITPVAGDESPTSVRTLRRGALKRHLAMPYVSFAALTPRQES
jgi:hypothetical protein